MARPLRILVTAFGPFPGMPVNPAQRAAMDLLRVRRPALSGVEIALEILPTRWDELPRLDALMTRRPFDAVLLLGVAARRRRVCLETRAVNAARTVPDAAGRHPPGRRLMTNEAEAFSTTAPALPWVATLRRAGIAACASRDAGRYLCNAAYFHALAAAHGWPRGAGAVPPILFVHLPGRSGVPRGASRAGLARALCGQLVALAAEARRRNANGPGSGPEGKGCGARAFSSEVDTASREENASMQESGAIAVSQGERKTL
ncbi:peptidase C15 [Xanthobacter autotrophicus]|uniref:pyroglutamyl-peptidase I family protein n=1 Tax=Xanthobacter autotrophicus TaxID=280 RepID=UPI0024A737B7|nr:peptidase C15 [Xanthobacter autotrophicus]MDI4658728.1 peptidase C15 [Xanthobacter autotrophicus]